MGEKTLGIKILLARKDVGITQAELAKRLETAASVVNHWEKDKFSPSLTSLRKLSLVLKKPISYFSAEGNAPEVAEPQAQYGKVTNSLKLPIFDRIPASFPEYHEHDVVGFASLPRFMFPGASFIVRRDGDYYVVREEKKIVKDVQVLVRTSKGFSVRTFTAVPENADILGRVMGVIKKID